MLLMMVMMTMTIKTIIMVVMMVMKMLIRMVITGDDHDESIDYKYDMSDSDCKDYEDNNEDARYIQGARGIDARF